MDQESASPPPSGGPWHRIATAGGLGLLRPAPGTWGSLGAAALALAWILCAPPALITPGLTVAALAAALVGIPASAITARRMGIKDPSLVVIDEVAGQWVALALVPASVLVASPAPVVILALVAFRAFDIMKPWPISWLETLPGGWGIMADDLAAGVCAGLLTTALTV